MQGANQGQDRTDNNEWKQYDTGGVGIEDLMAKKEKDDDEKILRLFLKNKTKKFSKNQKINFMVNKNITRNCRKEKKVRFCLRSCQYYEGCVNKAWCTR